MEFSGVTRLNTPPSSVPAPANESNQGIIAAPLNVQPRADSGGRVPASARAGRKRFSRSELGAVVLLLAAIGVFYGFTMRPGDPWSDDFAQYVQHARNISERKPYAQTDYLFLKDAWNPGPAVYPPVFPLLLAPLYQVTGPDLRPMKLLVLAFFIGALLVIYLTFREELGSAGAWALIAVIGFNPFFWDFKDSVLSDIPFLFLCYLALYLTEMAVSRERSGTRFAMYAVMAGLAVYAGCGTRVAGIVMIPAILAWSVIRYGKVTQSAAVIVTLSTALELAEIWRLHTFQATFTALQRGRSSSVISQGGFFARYYVGSLDRLWSNGHSPGIRLGFFAVTVALMLVGLLAGTATRPWREVRVHDAFVLLYLPMLVNAPQARYLIPIIPLYLFYVISGVQWAVRRVRGRYGVALVAGLAAVVAVTYAADYRTLDLHHLPFGTASPEAQEMFAYVEAHAAPSDVVEFFAPRTLALYTHRKSTVYPHVPAPTQADMQAYFCEARVTYVVTSPWFRDPVVSDFIAANRGAWSEPFANGRFDVYELPEEGPGSACRTTVAYSR